MTTPTEFTYTRWADIPIEPMSSLLGRQFVVGSNVMVSRITLAKGAHVPLHSHPNEQVAVLLTGCLEFLLRESLQDAAQSSPSPRVKQVILRPGELLCIPPNVPHEAFALEDTVNLDIFCPPRQDWIDGNDGYLRG